MSSAVRSVRCVSRPPEMSSSTQRVAKPATRHLCPGERWFAVQSQPHRELVAANHLRNQGFRVFLPLQPRTWRHARRVETRLVPFFSGYLFVVLDLDRDRWRSVNGTFGVQRLVTNGGETRPAPMPPGIIEAIMSKTDERGCLQPGGHLRVGQEVQILDGPFGDRTGELIALDDAGRVRVLIELLGGRIPALLSCDQVTAAR
jgi:transcription antitermination factor NusG